MTKELYHQRVRSFTRRERPLPERLERVMAQRAGDYLVVPKRGFGETTVHPDWRLDIAGVFGRESPLIVEIGSGHGEQIVAQAATYPEYNFLALEVWLPGIARTVEYAVAEGVRNLRVLPADAAMALRTALPARSVNEVWTFFPDPWRKNKHRKRRIVQVEFAEVIARLLVDGGHWHMATDWPGYAEHMRAVLRESPYFAPSPDDPAPTWADEDADAFSPRYARRIMTHFEARGERAGRPIRDLAAVRLPRSVVPDAETK